MGTGSGAFASACPRLALARRGQALCEKHAEPVPSVVRPDWFPEGLMNLRSAMNLRLLPALAALSGLFMPAGDGCCPGGGQNAPPLAVQQVQAYPGDGNGQVRVAGGFREFAGRYWPGAIAAFLSGARRIGPVTRSSWSTSQGPPAAPLQARSPRPLKWSLRSRTFTTSAATSC